MWASAKEGGNWPVMVFVDEGVSRIAAHLYSEASVVSWQLSTGGKRKAKQSSMGSWLRIKRDRAAERFNLARLAYALNSPYVI